MIYNLHINLPGNGGGWLINPAKGEGPKEALQITLKRHTNEFVIVESFNKIQGGYRGTVAIAAPWQYGDVKIMGQRYEYLLEEVVLKSTQREVMSCG